MVMINTKDKKIIHNLLLNSRQSLNSIGKKVGISKELVLYRIKKLQDRGIIQNFTTIIDNTKFGYSVLNFYYNFSNINPKLKNEIINHFVNSNQTSYVGLTEGLYDLQVDFFLGDPFEFEAFFDKTQVKYRKYFSNQTGSGPIRVEIYQFPFLVNENKNILEPIKLGWGSPIVKIDELDFKILNELSINARASIKEIAKKINSTITIVYNRIKKLIKNGIIMCFTVNIDWNKLGYRFFSIEIVFNDYSNRNKIINYFKKNPYIWFIIKPIGFNSDLECVLCLKNAEQFRNVVENLTNQYPDSIKSCNYFSTYQIFKHQNLPPKLLKNFNNPFLKIHS